MNSELARVRDPLAVALEDARRCYEVFGETAAFPRLLAGLDAVLARHSAWEVRDGDYGEGAVLCLICKECCAGGGVGQTEECADHHSCCWPCPTRDAIFRALVGLT